MHSPNDLSKDGKLLMLQKQLQIRHLPMLDGVRIFGVLRGSLLSYPVFGALLLAAVMVLLHAKDVTHARKHEKMSGHLAGYSDGIECQSQMRVYAWHLHSPTRPAQ